MLIELRSELEISENDSLTTFKAAASSEVYHCMLSYILYISINLHHLLITHACCTKGCLCIWPNQMICIQKSGTPFYLLVYLGGQSSLLQGTGEVMGFGMWRHMVGCTSFPFSVTQWILRSQVPLFPQEALHVVQSPKRQPKSVDPYKREYFRKP